MLPSCLRAQESCLTKADGFLFILRCTFTSQKTLWPPLKSSAASCKTGRTNNLWKQPNRLGMQGYSPLELPNMVVKTPFCFWNFNLSQENNDLQIALTTLNMICLPSGFKVDSFPLPKQQRATGWVTLVSPRNPLRRSEAQRSVRSKRTFQMPRMKRKGHEDVCFDANINVNRNTISCYHLYMK